MAPSENNIINGLKKGDPKAFTHVYKQHYSRLLYFAKQLTDDDHESEDIVSGVFIKLWHKRADFDNLLSLKAFLYIAARNACFDYLRYARRQADNKKDFQYWVDDKEEEILHLMLRAELLQEITDEINKLPQSFQAVCKLSFFEGLDNDAIAAQLHLSIKTVRNIKALAVKQIQTVFLQRKLIAWLLVLLGCCCH